MNATIQLPSAKPADSRVSRYDVTQGDIWLVNFAQSSRVDTKCRPSLVVSADRYNRDRRNRDILVVPLSRLRDRRPRPNEVVIDPSESLGALTEVTVTKVNRLQAVERNQLVKWVGNVDDSMLGRIMHCVDARLGCD